MITNTLILSDNFEALAAWMGRKPEEIAIEYPPGTDVEAMKSKLAIPNTVLVREIRQDGGIE